MCLGASTHGMVQRAFLEGFTVDIREAGQQEEADEAAAAAAAVAVEEANEAFQREKRARTRKIVKMMRKTNLAGELMTVVQSTSVIQQFQFDILTADVARRGWGSDDRNTSKPDESALDTEATTERPPFQTSPRQPSAVRLTSSRSSRQPATQRKPSRGGKKVVGSSRQVRRHRVLECWRGWLILDLRVCAPRCIAAWCSTPPPSPPAAAPSFFSAAAAA